MKTNVFEVADNSKKNVYSKLYNEVHNRLSKTTGLSVKQCFHGFQRTTDHNTQMAHTGHYVLLEDPGNFPFLMIVLEVLDFRYGSKMAC